MPTLWTFGDSFTDEFGYIDDGRYVYRDDREKKYLKYKKPGDDIWVNHLGKKLNYEIKNFGQYGSSNERIIDSIFENILNFNIEDVVIFSRTFDSRFDIPDTKTSKKFKTIHGEALSFIEKNMKSIYDIEDKLELQTILNYGVLFMDNNLYKKRYDLRFKTLEKLIKPMVKKVIYWEVDSNFRRSFEKIKEHTNYEINDPHFSFEGHKQISEYFYSQIDNKIKLL